MKRSLIVCVAALLVAAPAAAQDTGKRAMVSRAQLTATEAATAAGIPDAHGRAHLVDGRENDKVTLHMNGLEAGETYLWHVHQATAEGDPCAAGSTVGNPAPYPGWTYRELKARRSGNADSKGRSGTFPVAAGTGGGDYYVNVHLQDGTVIGCGVLEFKKAGPSGDSDATKAGRGRADDRPGRRRGP